MSQETSQRFTLAETVAKVDRAIRLDLMTAMPGEVIEYTPATRRAKVRGSLKLVLKDGTSMQRSVIHDVPVMWPQIGGYILHMDLQPGDRGWLSFSQRDLEAWKKEHAEVEPGPEGLLSEKDAAFYPTFGEGPNGDPLVPQGKASLQTMDGEFSVSIDADAETVTAKAKESTAVLDPQNIRADAPNQIRLRTTNGEHFVQIDGNSVHLRTGDTADFAVLPGHINGAIYSGGGTTVETQFALDFDHLRLVQGSANLELRSDVVRINGSGGIFLNGTRWSTHTHSGVEPGAGNTGDVN